MYPSQHMNPCGHQAHLPPPHNFPSGSWNYGHNGNSTYNDFTFNDAGAMSNFNGMTMDGLGISNGNSFPAESSPFASQQRSFNGHLPQLAQNEVRMETRLQELRSRIERLESTQRRIDERTSTMTATGVQPYTSLAGNESERQKRMMDKLQRSMENLTSKIETLEHDLYAGFTQFKAGIGVLVGVFGRVRELNDQITPSEKRHLTMYVEEDNEMDDEWPLLGPASPPSHSRR